MASTDANESECANTDISCIFLNKRRAWSLEEYAAILSGFSPGSGRHFSGNETRGYPPILESEPHKSVYLFHLQDLRIAVSTGELKASKYDFNNKPNEYVCLLEDFLEWAKTNQKDIYAQYMYNQHLGVYGNIIEEIQRGIQRGDYETVAPNEKSKLKIPDQRNEIAKKWLSKIDPDLDVMNDAQILKELGKFALTFQTSSGELVYKSKLFSNTSAKSWLSRDHSVIPKRKPGCKAAINAVKNHL